MRGFFARRLSIHHGLLSQTLHAWPTHHGKTNRSCKHCGKRSYNSCLFKAQSVYSHTKEYERRENGESVPDEADPTLIADSGAALRCDWNLLSIHTGMVQKEESETAASAASRWFRGTRGDADWTAVRPLCSEMLYEKVIDSTLFSACHITCHLR